MPTWPFQKMRSPRFRSAKSGGVFERNAQSSFLHVTVPRARNPTNCQRDLHQSGAVETERGLSAPQIRHANEAFGHSDEIGFIISDRGKMRGRNVAAALRDRQAVLRRVRRRDGRRAAALHAAAT